MPAIFYVDQARTFKRVTFLSCQPKMAFGESGRQDTTRDGTPKWEIQVAATFEQFGKLENEILKISIASHQDLNETIEGAGLIELVGFRVRVNTAEKRAGKISTEHTFGGSVTYQADSIRGVTPVE
ncbi:hypothetical protein ABZT03_43910 [Streptomyces sp. NPDC005574]|uniref:hypothetical protein n=1 Tax=Streptomyces sp. NPDC005574 TaxID=3156891 RepID=UPI0033BA1465